MTKAQKNIITLALILGLTTVGVLSYRANQNKKLNPTKISMIDVTNDNNNKSTTNESSTTLSQDFENCNTSIAENKFSLDFAKCTRCTNKISAEFGSTIYQMEVSTDKNHCLLKYGGEIENPNWNGELNMTCQIPRTHGTQTFNITQYGVDFSPAGQYCKTIR